MYSRDRQKTFCFRYQDTNNSDVSEGVEVWIHLIKTLLPYSFYCVQQGSPDLTDLILQTLQSFVMQILALFEKNSAPPSRTGYITHLLDRALDNHKANENSAFITLITDILRWDGRLLLMLQGNVAGTKFFHKYLEKTLHLNHYGFVFSSISSLGYKSGN